MLEEDEEHDILLAVQVAVVEEVLVKAHLIIALQ